MIAQIILNGLMMGAAIALMAIGLTLIFGILRTVNFWHGEAYMFGAVVVFYCVVKAGINYWLGVVVAVAVIGALGWISDRLIFRRFHGNLMGGAIAAIAISMGFQNITWLIFGTRPQKIPSIVTGQWRIFGAVITAERLLIIVVSLTVISALIWFIKHHKFGKAMRAVQEDSEAALTLGINVGRVCALTFGIATALAALAGAIIAPVFFIDPIMGSGPLMYAFIVIILGGMGSVMGAFIASFIIGFQQSITASFWGPQFSMGVSFGLALIVLILRPRGLMGHD